MCCSWISAPSLRCRDSGLGSRDVPTPKEKPGLKTMRIAGLVASAVLLVGAGVTFAVSASELSTARSDEVRASRAVSAARADQDAAAERLSEAQEKRELAEKRASSRRAANSFFDGLLGDSSVEYEEELAEAERAYDPVEREYEAVRSEEQAASREANVAVMTLEDAERSHSRATVLAIALAAFGLLVGVGTLVANRVFERTSST